MSETLNPRRVALLMRADLLTWYRTLGIVSAAAAGVIVLAAVLLKSDGAAADHYYFGWFAVLLFLAGLILTSRGFRDLHDKTRNAAFLLLPASAFEKTLARLLILSVGYIAFLVLFVTLVSIVGEAAIWLVRSRWESPFDPFDTRVWQLAGHFVILQSVFFLGAAWFRSSHLFKTVLTMVLLIAAYIGIVALLGRVLLRRMMSPEFITTAVENMSFGFYEQHRLIFDAAGIAVELAYFVVLPVFCWTVAWIRITETQVSDGV
jgi:hypothetical protein